MNRFHMKVGSVVVVWKLDLQIPICNQCLSSLTLWVQTRSGEVYSIQHCVIKFVSDLRQVGGFLRVLPISSTNKTDHHDITEILCAPHTKYPKFFRASLCMAQLFLSAPPLTWNPGSAPGTVKTFIKLYLPESKTEVILTAHTLANSKDIYKTIPSWE